MTGILTATIWVTVLYLSGTAWVLTWYSETVEQQLFAVIVMGVSVVVWALGALRTVGAIP